MSEEDLWPPYISRRGMLQALLAGAGFLTGTGTTVRTTPGIALARPAIISPVAMWAEIALQAVRETRLGPPMVARALAIVHTCIYDAWAAYDPVAAGTRMGGALRRPSAERTFANKTQAISFAAYRALADLFPSQIDTFQRVMAGLGYDPADTTLGAATPTGIGNLVAQAVLDFRHGDGSNQLGDLHPGPYSDYTGYAPINDPNHIHDPNRWQPLRVADGHGGFVVQTYVGAQWGLVTPFALASGSQFRPAAPARYPSQLYRRQAAQMLHYSANLDDSRKVIAEFWADGPSTELPPGHWCLFAHDVSRRNGYGLDEDARLFFAVTNAAFDAGIAVWNAKRAFDSVRPVTAIHYLYKGKKVRAWAGPGRGSRIINGEDWQPYQQPTVVTPAFPEYVSGHSGFSAACAEVLKCFTGSDYFGGSHTIRAGSSPIEPGITPAVDVTLSWRTFSDAAAQAGLSRRYGGIHFPDGDLMGRAIGRQVGRQVWKKAQMYFSGHVDSRS